MQQRVDVNLAECDVKYEYSSQNPRLIKTKVRLGFKKQARLKRNCIWERSFLSRLAVDKK